MINLLFIPMLVYVLWVIVLYVLLTLMRGPKVWGIGLNSDGSNPFTNIELRTSANLTNQFELPVLFYALCVVLISRPEFLQSIYVWLAWVFVVGRILHSVIQIFTSNVRLRGLVFTVNFVSVIAMWCVLSVALLGQ